MTNIGTKRFEDWEEVNCNECSRYWDDSCDGVKKGSRKPCTSFLATRSVVIPQQLNALRKAVKWLYAYLIFEWVVAIIAGVVKLFG